MIRLTIEPLVRETFRPFGDVLEWRPGDVPRHDFAARISSDRPAARPNLRVQRSQPVALPLACDTLERHVHSSQTFAPLTGTPYLVVVCPARADGGPMTEAMRAFRAAGHQAVTYPAGQWHRAFAALDTEGTFLMLRFDDGTPQDEEFRPLDSPVTIVRSL